MPVGQPANDDPRGIARGFFVSGVPDWRCRSRLCGLTRAPCSTRRNSTRNGKLHGSHLRQRLFAAIRDRPFRGDDPEGSSPCTRIRHPAPGKPPVRKAGKRRYRFQRCDTPRCPDQPSYPASVLRVQSMYRPRWPSAALRPDCSERVVRLRSRVRRSNRRFIPRPDGCGT
jgi:hypothetical protein